MRYEDLQRLRFVRFGLATQTPHLILQLSTRAPERVVHRKMNVAVTFVGAWRTAYIDFPSIRQSKANVDFVQAAAAVVLAGRSHDDMASGYPAESIFESGNIAGDPRAPSRSARDRQIRFAALFP